MVRFQYAQQQAHLKRAKNLARNTVSAFDFIVETLRAESRHLAHIAVSKVTTQLTGHAHKPQRDVSLDPLAGVPVQPAGVMDDPLANWSR